ncbi:Macrolide export ATP-binding/permease macB [Corynebacterium humireducens NBRC 106098 = DSM 45392]|uniref:Macrolide export ATP-binding/permease macB n=1 Tax=Corynebacterium humireducens NBRC 106098 = DSM 45392 TaxID=1223515 RepID=A0A0B5DF34_9CORY|nr:ABC transporter permease [Corynebacterium humireducens]AJE34354.1 Macrolide export ATP-binding/permease macB [Corynebacterium humireducens NBRC 106098 = DSM 45392]
MFLGIRDIVHARGRFALIGSVVGLITLLLVMLTGLTGGLGAQNVSALRSLDPDRVVFASEEPSFTESRVTAADVAAWEKIDGVTSVRALGAVQTRMETGTTQAVAVLGLPDATPGAVLSESLLDATPGTVLLGGQEVPVVGTTADEHYSHSPVVWVDTATWQAIARDEAVGTALLVEGDADWEAASASTGMTAVTLRDSFSGLASHQSEQGSLQTMQGFLYGISALVTVSFLTVWTIQRTRDLSILRALGATPGYLVRDALGQASIILAVGVGAGALAGWALGTLAGQAVPFELSTLTVAGPALGIWVLGIAGAFLATRRVAKVDPLIALGGNG